jgi:integrase/recombinase XerD
MIKLVDLLEESYQKDVRRLEKGLIVPNTFRIVKTRFNNTINYLTQSNQLDIEAEKINLAFIDQFREWLEIDMIAGTAHTSRHITHIKQVLNEAELREKIAKNKISKYICKRKNKFLNNHIELAQMERIDTTTFRPALKRIADLFLFACHTGLAFAELERFTWSQHVQMIDGKEWIVMVRKKTESNNECFYVPVFEGTKKILERLNFELPKISNQKYNEHLKEIAIICGIDTKLTTHSARKTFAILATERYKFSLESISYMLGHSDIKTTQAHYARVRLNTVKNELAKMMA